MAELHLTDIDEEVVAQLQQRAKQQNRSIEAVARDELERTVALSSSDTAEEETFRQTIERLRSTPAEDRVPDVEPAEIQGIPASELLIRDRRRR